MKNLFIILIIFFVFVPLSANAKNCLDAPEGFSVQAENDADGDGVLDAKDNCPFVVNKDQEDGNLDSVGNACDQDADGLPNHCDNCSTVSNSDQKDENENGKGDLCENVETKKKKKPFLSRLFKKKDISGKKVAVVKKEKKKKKPKKLKLKNKLVMSETKVKNDYAEFSDDFSDFIPTEEL